MKRLLVALVAGNVAAILAACGGSPPTQTPSPTAAITPTAASPTQAVTTPQPTIRGLRAGTWPAGRYHTNFLEPQVILTLPEGWGLYFDDAGGAFLNVPGGEFLVGRPTQVIDPATGDPAPAPEDLLSWLADHPGLNSTEPTSTEISGHDAGWIEIDPAVETDVFYDPLGNFHVAPGKNARFYVVSWDGPDLLAAVLRSEAGTFEKALEAGVPIAESMEIVP